MPSLYAKIFAILLVFLGETFFIYAEITAAKNNALFSGSFWSLALKLFLLVIMAGGLLIAGYAFGFVKFKNIWIISVTSLTSILIMEPLMAYLIVKQLPTKGAFVGLILGALGFITTLTL